MQNLFQDGAIDISEIANIVKKFYVKKIQICVVRIIQFCLNFASLC